MITMNIYNNQGAWMGTFQGATPAELLADIRSSGYDLTDCHGETDDYLYCDDMILSNEYFRETLAV